MAACSSHDGGKPALHGAPAGNASAHAPANDKTAFALVSVSSEMSDSHTALTLQFNAPLASAQTFDQQIAVTEW